MPGSDSKFIFLCLEEFIQLIVNCFVPNLALNEKTRVTAISVIIVWVPSILLIYY